MHTKTGRCVDFDDGAADFLVGLRDIGGEEVNATHVQSNRLHGPHGHFTIIRMHDIGHVNGRAAGRQVGSGTQIKGLALRQYGR